MTSFKSKFIAENTNITLHWGIGIMFNILDNIYIDITFVMAMILIEPLRTNTFTYIDI